jgi:chemotaxis receptor (MCP) glutamine deamidase CheD
MITSSIAQIAAGAKNFQRKPLNPGPRRVKFFYQCLQDHNLIVACMKHHHVSAGSFFVGPKQPLVVEAFLATCVGLALVDEEKGVGGLAHFLLPEPVSLSSVFQPEKYASTGIPLFLKAILAAGARRERMKATLAGGALIGPVGDMDISLNIGGRTAERIEALLREEAIPIVQAETGGSAPAACGWTCSS